jgi:hypothetical protein
MNPAALFLLIPCAIGIFCLWAVATQHAEIRKLNRQLAGARRIVRGFRKVHDDAESTPNIFEYDQCLSDVEAWLDSCTTRTGQEGIRA